jgi:nicotinate-nucleotide--dimethylbenzimidazole phosphoribosyltransferase
LVITSFADIRRLLSALPGPGTDAIAACDAREPTLTKPAGSLGRLEEIARHLSAWQGRHPPKLDKVRARVFAGNHGVTAQGVSAFPSEVTVQMVANFEHGGAAINQLCRAFDIELKVTALELDRPTADFTLEPAMSESECARAFDAGFQSVPEDTDLLVVGEMGIGNTTSAAALCHALFGGRASDWTGRGTGVDDQHLKIKIDVVGRAVARHCPSPERADPLEVLRCLGGRELAAMAGAIVAARTTAVPVMLDGFVCGAAAGVVYRAAPGGLDHCLAGHVSAEPGHRRLLDAVGKRPLLALDMRLGEASGAALAVGLARGALACHTGMATFAQAGVSDKE